MYRSCEEEEVWEGRGVDAEGGKGVMGELGDGRRAS